MSEQAAWNWCEKANEPYSISIEEFAKLLKVYIDRKGPKHHVVFLVDEMGQFIGEDSQLMLNLQTITEDFGRICQGRVWVIVTSQQDIDSITKLKDTTFLKSKVVLIHDCPYHRPMRMKSLKNVSSLKMKLVHKR